MALDTSLLYGLVVASAIGHAALAFLLYTVMRMTGYMGISALQVGLCVVSFFIQFGLLAALQANTCGGMRDYGSVAKGAALSLLFVGAFTLLPVYVPYLREIVAWLAPRATAADAERARILEQAGINLQAVSAGIDGAEKVMPPDVLTTSLEAYNKEVFLATTKAVAFWAAFAGAYGIGVGSLVAAKCPAIA